MVEGHTDSVPYVGNNILVDNWDLSVKRSTSIIRVLTNELGVNPAQLIAAGRSSYIPLVENDSAENRARNRRTRIVVLPKIDQFYEMIEQEMKTRNNRFKFHSVVCVLKFRNKKTFRIWTFFL
jgi:chemotaxis protein MotB